MFLVGGSAVTISLFPDSDSDGDRDIAGNDDGVGYGIDDDDDNENGDTPAMHAKLLTNPPQARPSLKSLTMHTSTFLLGLATAFASVSSAHTLFSNIFINAVNQGDGTCIRMEMTASTATYPVRDYKSKEMACGRDGQNAVAFTCRAPAGAKLTLEFREYVDLAHPGAIDPSHKGARAVYAKKVSNMQTTSAAGGGWFKIWDEGYDEKQKLWSTIKLNNAKGLLSIRLPSGLPSGYYLLRSEIVTIQNVTNGVVAPQFYIGCAQLYVQGADDAAPIPDSKTVSIPGHIHPSDIGITFNIYEVPLKLPYVTLGPKPYIPTSSTSASSIAKAAAVPFTGAVPDTCLLKNANWCGIEVPSYTDEDGCWAASSNCWKQQDTCYDMAPPTGSKGCAEWDKKKCTVIQNKCKAGDFVGPPDKGVKLPNVDADNVDVNALPPVQVEDESENEEGTAADVVVDGGESGEGDETPASASVYVTVPVAEATATSAPVAAATPGCGCGCGRRVRQ
ncbi:glycosyl hydrolase family 61-domain-containing protein [Cercophora scortea]|uniref:lytic cellulose monooxygenase (C4-dehydrogenating) n=1 Tax=Cercophora scortea TaxID=314031 RepID=A0AAE0M9Q2_9PEZI|nr:glycosyl hydrolase family 61-domain-containing protein [Cercophora scortea]